MQLTSAMKVGIVVFIGLCFLAAAVFIIGDIQFLNKRYYITVKFTHVDGLLEGAKVTFAGVKVGKVERIDIKSGFVFVRISVAEKIKLPKCTRFTIDTAGLMGEKYLGMDMAECETGKQDEYFKDGEEAKGIEPLRLSQLFGEGEKIMQKVSKSMESINKVLGDEKVIDSSRNMIVNAYEITLSAKNFMASLEDRIDGIQDNIEELLKDFGDVGEALAAVIEDNKTNITELIQNYRDAGFEFNELISENKKNVSELVSNMNKTTFNLNKLISRIEDEGKTAEKIKEMLENFRKTSKNVEEATSSVKGILTDETLESELKGSLKSVASVAKKADRILSGLKGGAMKLLYTFRMDKNDKKTHNDMAIKLTSSGDKSFLVGVRNIGNGNQLDAQICQDGGGKLIKRMGIIKSKVGIGVDYKWKKNVLYSVDLIDTHDTQVETTSVYKLKNNISLQSKVENALKKKERNYNVGIQYAF
ncbi:MAG TPA: MlaD family protein [Candidatus Wallbacteria bacterium]|nr:MlaD family protein [Candidatus Wallbacteria bacterium]